MDHTAAVVVNEGVEPAVVGDGRTVQLARLAMTLCHLVYLDPVSTPYVTWPLDEEVVYPRFSTSQHPN
jgi:hypothetical protein